jgi:hypothetical protein
MPSSNGRADLHLHTHFSDGTWSPRELVGRALARGLAAIAVTDHDTVGGVLPAIEAARGTALRVLAGVEISTLEGSTDLHLLGYGLDPADPRVHAAFERFRDARYARGEEMVKKLQQMGVGISMEEVRAAAGEGTIGRPHVAAALKARGFVETANEAFRRFIGYDGPAYVPKFKLGAAEGVRLLLEVGAVPVFAHPATTRRDELIPELAAEGLLGLEVVHSRHSPATEEHYRMMADRLGLVATGGSDSHGGRDTPEPLLGAFTVPAEAVSMLERMAGRLNPPRG